MTKIFGSATTALAVCLAVGGAFWAGCGDDDDGGDGALFFGDVSTVTASVVRPEQPRFAWSFLPGPSLAWAQSTCGAPSGGNLLFCVNDVCTIVQPNDCSFSQVVEIVEEPAPALLSFIDDDNEDAEATQGELVSLVPHTLVFCNGDRVRVSNAAINFQTGTSTAVVTKEVDACATNGTPRPTNTPGGGATPTPTIGGGGNGTPTAGTPTAGTPTPTTYAYSASLQEAPPTALAFLASLGVIGLLIPTRRRRKD